MLDSLNIAELKASAAGLLQDHRRLRNRALIAAIVLWLAISWLQGQLSVAVATSIAAREPIQPPVRLLATILPALAVPLVLLCVYVLWLFPGNRRGFERLQHARKLVFSLLPDLPDYAGINRDPKVQARRSLVWFMMIMAAVVVSSFVMSGLRIPSPLDLPVLFGVIMLVSWLPGWLQRQDANLPEATRQHLWRNSVDLVPMGGAVLTAMISGAIAYGVFHLGSGSPMLASFMSLMFGYAFGLTVLMKLSNRQANRLARSSLGAGNYEAALATTQQQLEKHPDELIYLINRGNTLNYAGQYAEAEAIWRRAVTETQNSLPNLPSMLSQLAQAFSNTGQDTAAERLYIATLEIMPEANQGYFSMAYFYLQRNEPEAARRVLDALPAPVPRKVSGSVSLRHNGAWNQMVLAWSLAASGQPTQADALMRATINSADPGYKPGLASLLELAGRTKQAMGEPDSARVFYQKAADLDPQGSAGQRALKSLETVRAEMDAR